MALGGKVKSFKFEARCILSNESYLAYVEAAGDAAQKRIWTFYKAVNSDDLVKSPKLVTPAQAGVQNILELLDSGLRQNDGCAIFRLFTSPSILYGGNIHE